jgi:hypothetical protein
MRLSADPTGEIDELVEALESAHTPWQKVRVLAKRWQTVRKLRPDERFLVAQNVGLEGAEVFLDKLGDAYRGLPTDDLLDIVRAAEAEDFERWKGVVSRFRRPEEREALLRKGLEHAKEALLEEPVEHHEVEPIVHDEPEPLAAETIEETPPLPPVGAEEPVEDVETAPESEPEPEQEERLEESPREAEVEEIELEEPVDLPAEELEPIEVEPEPELESEAALLLARLTAAGTVLSRLRRFTMLREEMAQLEASTLEQLLESLPPGWARRRALVRLFDAGIPEDLQDALLLIDRLERRSDRLWCLSALVDSRTLTQEEREMVLGRVDSPAARRRLEIRLSA